MQGTYTFFINDLFTFKWLLTLPCSLTCYLNLKLIKIEIGY